MICQLKLFNNYCVAMQNFKDISETICNSNFHVLLNVYLAAKHLELSEFSRQSKQELLSCCNPRLTAIIDQEITYLCDNVEAAESEAAQAEEAEQ